MKSVKESPVEKSKSKTPSAAPETAVTGSRKWAPWLITLFFAGWVVGNLPEPRDKTPFNINEFAKLPVVLEGRVQPMDSVARNTLLLMRGKSTLAIEGQGAEKTVSVPAIEWLLEVMTRPEEAQQRKVFRIDHSELLGMLKLPLDQKYFSFNEVIANGEGFQKETERLEAQTESQAEQRTVFEKAVVRLAGQLTTFVRLRSSLQPMDSENFAEEVAAYEKSIPGGVAALKGGDTTEGAQNADVKVLAKKFQRFDQLSHIAYPLIIPPTDPANANGWQNIGASLKEAMRTGSVHPAAKAYAAMATAYAKNQPEAFNAAIEQYRDGFLKGTFAKQLTKGRQEQFFNRFEFFIKALTIYLVALLFGCAYWIRWSPWLRSAGMGLALVAFVVHATGLIFRMHLEGRPPVTNLYSSAIFVGFGAVVLGLILERIFKDGIGLVVASFIGFGTLVIAHNLSLDGDTMKLLQAVLDTNIWLATHVVVITLGYASMFLAGFLGIVYVLRGFFTKNFPAATAKSLGKMVYGIVCFATLFSFVGTVLGGIWADQSWGRFWGWDPKENGALIIVIWSAIILHARWGGMIRERGLMGMAIFGNIVTSFSWFGVNMLGVGLHSYGFMDEAFKWLVGFIVSQVILIVIACMPPQYWRSGVVGAASTRKNDGTKQQSPEGEFAAAQKMMPGESAS
jgi:ABC-type transport system involved in cytochrome c biogenesis permease subunit